MTNPSVMCQQRQSDLQALMRGGNFPGSKYATMLRSALPGVWKLKLIQAPNGIQTDGPSFGNRCDPSLRQKGFPLPKKDCHVGIGKTAICAPYAGRFKTFFCNPTTG